LVNSGTEAVMTAVRVARGFTGRDKIVVFEGCYHGHSDGLLAKAGSGVAELSEAASKGIPQSIVAETLNAKFDDLEGLEDLFQKYGSRIAATARARSRQSRFAYSDPRSPAIYRRYRSCRWGAPLSLMKSSAVFAWGLRVQVVFMM
jgi:4-aminobutyrate aminotransferase-like enzyme